MHRERLIQHCKELQYIVSEYWNNNNFGNTRLLEMLDKAKSKSLLGVKYVLNTYYKFIPNYYREKVLDNLWYCKSAKCVREIFDDILSVIDTPKEAIEVLE